MSPPRPEIAVEFSVEDGVAATWDEPPLTELVHAIVRCELQDGLLASSSTVDDARFVIGLHLVSEASIRALNAEHRDLDAATDVLSFPLLGEAFVVPPDEPVNLGDVVISHQRAREQAAEYGHSEQREVAYLVAHGVLHILGYDHEQPIDKERMRQREEA